MKRMLVVVVDNADKAYEGASALERLSEESTIGAEPSSVASFRTWPTQNRHTRSPRLRPTSLKKKAERVWLLQRPRQRN
jgi:hypothetical protein